MERAMLKGLFFKEICVFLRRCVVRVSICDSV